MCGIFGFYLRRPLTAKDVESGKLATDKLSHRGPDNTGYWNNTKQGVFLGHTRLSIQDTSKSNNQPYKRDNIKLVFNGEIYNFLELRNNLINQSVCCGISVRAFLIFASSPSNLLICCLIGSVSS